MLFPAKVLAIVPQPALGQKQTCNAHADVRYVPKADIANIGLSVSAKIKTLSKFYFTTPQAIRAPPPPKGFGWSE